MTNTTLTPETLKKKAKAIREFLKEKYETNVSHGHCVEIVSKIYGFKDWNTASATLKTKENQNPFPIKIGTVRDMKKALELFNDTDSIDADYTFNIQDFLSDLEDYHSSKDEIYQEFSLSIKGRNEGIVTFVLKLEHESMSIAP